MELGEVSCSLCFECMERRIRADLSEEVVFLHGISSDSSPFPLGSSAVVQIPTLAATAREENGTASDEGQKRVNVHLYFAKKLSGNRHSENDTPTSTSLNVDDNHDKEIPVTPQELGLSSSEKPSFYSMIATLSPARYVSKVSYSIIKELVTEFSARSTEDHVILSLNKLGEGKLDISYGMNFLKLIGYSIFDGFNATGSVRHPNVSPILGVLDVSDTSYVLQPETPFNLENIIQYSPQALSSDWHVRFLMFQVLSALAFLHDSGVSHSNLRPSSILLTDSLWSWLRCTDIHTVKGNSRLAESLSPSVSSCCSGEDCPCQTIFCSVDLVASVQWHEGFMKWWKGEMSNYDYLLLINRLSGRRWGDPTFHSVMPWVIDFSVKPDEDSSDGWRDLTKSKWRLAKGDEQLDFTYSTSEIPHHVSDECLSELAVCSYKARRLPLSILRTAVRSVYEPNEYPSNMQRIYQWTPDECIPEFYSDPRLFISIHPEMSNLALPSWCSSADEFISLHRDALECRHVSQDLHYWLDITFGYKLSGPESVDAKNVMLPISDPTRPKSSGRRQIFSKPHPRRHGVTPHHIYHGKKASCSRCRVEESKKECQRDSGISVPLKAFPDVNYLKDLEEATLFSEHESHLSPTYGHCSTEENFCLSALTFQTEFSRQLPDPLEILLTPPANVEFSSLIDSFEDDVSGSLGFHDFLHWNQWSSSLRVSCENYAKDIYSFGCILAEIYLQKPLFDATKRDAYMESGIKPTAFQALPPHVALIVEACIERKWERRPSAKSLLKSPYFPSSVRSVYKFVAPMQLLCKPAYILRFAAKLAKEGALRAMGAFAAEMCAPYCLLLILEPLIDGEIESALHLLKEFLKSLNVQAVKDLILPVIQKILQTAEYSHMKVFLLQDSFIQELWKKLGKQTYLQKIHPLIIANLCNVPNKITAAAASVVLIGSSEELGVPITIHQTVLPLFYSFGKGLSAEGIDTLARIGSHMGVSFILNHLLPMLRRVILASFDVLQMNKPVPQHVCYSLIVIDGLSTLNGLISVLPVSIVVKELIEDPICLLVKMLMLQLDLSVTQVAATTFVSLCQRIGAELTSAYLLPQLKELFAELAFLHAANTADISGTDLKLSEISSYEDIKIQSRMDLVLLLYPFLASFVGIEKLREYCSAWFLLEQTLLKTYNWKCQSPGKGSKSSEQNQRSLLKDAYAEESSSKVHFNEIGQSVPLSHKKGGANLTTSKQTENGQIMSMEDVSAVGLGNPFWFWFPGTDSGLDLPDFFGRNSVSKDEVPWKIKGTVLYSARAHPGALRSLSLFHDECTVFTGGVGPGCKGSVQKWELPSMNCISGYYGHDEVVNAVVVLSVTGRVASSDGTIHVWNGQTGKLLATYAESPTNFPFQSASQVSMNQAKMLSPNVLSGGMLSDAFNGNMYTCMHYFETDDKLVAGTGSGSLRFIDVCRDQKLHIWKIDSTENTFSSLVSAICFCGFEKAGSQNSVSSSSLLAVGLSSGFCRLIDARCGNIVASWHAHDGYITKLSAPECHLLLSSSLDKTLRIWDLRRNLSSQSNIFKGHSDGISSFAVWGQDVISISKNKIALTSLSAATNEGRQQQLFPQHLYLADRGLRNPSVLSTINVLPFSRLFLVGTEDGYLKICC